MKRILSLRMIVVAAVYLGLAITTLPGALQAQGTGFSVANATAENPAAPSLVNGQTALSRLETALFNFKTTLSTMQPHTIAYDELVYKFEYYSRIQNSLANSRDQSPSAVWKAIVLGSEKLVEDFNNGLISKARYHELYDGVIALLTP